MNRPCGEPPLGPSVRGLRCPQCGGGHWRVVYTRRADGGRIIRRRECRHCGTRVTTWERLVGTPRDS